MSTAVTRDPSKVIADILKSELGLADGRVMLEYQKFDIDPDPGLYVAVSYVAPKALGSTNCFNSDTLEEEQQVVMTDLIQIDIMSFNAEARERRTEILMALSSMLSQRLQAENNISIARLPSAFANASSLEETGWLNRFVVRVVVHSVYSKKKQADYFGNFPADFRTQYDRNNHTTEVENNVG